jgi:predicted nucleotidyltransferase component of viral defense system
VLKIFFTHRSFDNLAFVGGTALRILFDLRRYSEDLNFCLIKKSRYNFELFSEKLGMELEKAGLRNEVSGKKHAAVYSMEIKFLELLQRLELAEVAGQKLKIKVEIDTNPAKGWDVTVHPITRGMVLAVKHYDLPSLFATKLHACFFRPYVKGRDFYDLVWYLGKKIQPNFRLLNNAIQQTEKIKSRIDEKNFRDFMRERLAEIDFKNVRRDVERFLEDKSELQLLDKQLILKMIA